MKRCAIYARISTSDQLLDGQLCELRQFSVERHLEVVREYTDVGVSGRRSRRPGLDSMLRDARDGRFSVVLIAGFDRLARSTKHFLSVVVALDGLGIELISRRENISDEANIKQFMTFIASIAGLEAELIRERIKAGMRRRRLDGLHVGRQPLNVDRESIVSARLRGLSLTDVAKRYGVSRASVVRWVREAGQLHEAKSGQGVPSLVPRR